MKTKLSFQTPKFLLSLLLIFFTTLSYSQSSCGEIAGFEFSNGTSSISVANGETVAIDELPSDFYLNLLINGKSGSAKYIIENLDTGEIHRITENVLPYTFPAGNRSWNLGVGSFKIKANLYKYNFGIKKCDSNTITFTVIESNCAADAGTLKAVESTVALGSPTTMISAEPDGNMNVPSGYSYIYVLTSGEDLVIEQVSDMPKFDVVEAGLYTIHTLVYDGNADSPNFLDLSIVDFGTTTGGAVLGIVTEAGICASLDVAGAPITVVEESTECAADAGTLYSMSPISCFSEGTTIITADIDDAPIVPVGYNQLYVLTNAFNLTILNVSETPEFEISDSGFYRIHSLVYDPNTLDLSLVTPGVTTGFDVVELIEENGICASLDVQGAINLVIKSRWFCDFFNMYFSSSTSRTTNNDISAKDLEYFVKKYKSFDAFRRDFISNNTIANIYPNPVAEKFNIEMNLLEDEDIKFSIIDIQGRKVMFGSAKELEFGKKTIKTNGLNDGVYLIQLESEYRTITKKIIINK